MTDGMIRTLSSRRFGAAAAAPRKPEPFDMAKWRKEWGAFWGANGKAVAAMIRGERV